MPDSTESRNPLAARGLRQRLPPDYNRRSVRMRIFMMLALLMLVLAAADRARDPQTWKWLTELNRGNTTPREKIQNRLTPKPMRTAADAPDSFIAAAENASETVAGQTPSQADGPFDPTSRAWRQGWKDVFERLDSRQRLLLFELLYAAEQHLPLPAKRQEPAARALELAGRLWEDYQAAAFQSLVNLPEEDRQEWIDVLRQVNARWSGDVQPSLQAIIDGRTPTENEQLLLSGFQQTLDEIALAQVEDDTLFLRPAEREIWLRLTARARDAAPEDLRRAALGKVGYLQLFKQPDEYRGQPVTVRGTVKFAYRTPASDNCLGVTEHYVLWIMPDGGPTSPVVVYALAMPAGFPAIEASRDGGLTKLHEDVELTGFFLKRGAYLGKDGTYTAPLLIANVPRWNERQLSLQTTSRFAFGPAWLVPTVAAALAIAACCFGLVWWRLRRDEAESRRAAAGQAVPPDLSGLQLRPGTAEALRQLAQDEQDRV